jgi:hemerythrin
MASACSLPSYKPRALKRWLTEHILTADGRLGTYLSQAM